MKYLNWLLVLIAPVAMAQYNQPLYMDTTFAVHTSLELDGGAEFQGSSLRVDMSNTLLWGGFIDEAMKNRSFEKHGEINRFGFTSNNEIRFYNGKGGFGSGDSLTWALKAGYYATGSLSYGKDVFGLLFYGNESYLDQTADFSNTTANFMVFQKIGGGIVNKYTHSGLFLNVVNVQQAFKGTIREGLLTQNADATQIDLDARGDMFTTTGNSFSKGLGLALDGEYRLETPWVRGRSAWFQVSAQNVGFAYLHQGVTTYQVDSSYQYTGFELDQLTAEDNAFDDDFSLLDSMGIEKSSEKRWVVLPGYLQVAKMVNSELATKWQTYFGIRLYPSLNSVPMAFFGVHYQPIKTLSLAVSGSYGGFGGFRSGLYVNYSLPKISISLGTDDSVGWVWKNAFGKSVLLRMSWNLN
jgi:hypothetical protein